jgi:catechol 2,3-dioxygenase-like lactoylglutathione lyase family enzyme
MILALHHAQITVPTSMEVAAVRFYADVLGLPLIDKPPSLQHRGGAWFQIGDQQIHLAIEDHVNRAATKAHLAYEVSDLDFWRRRLLDNGVIPIESVPIPGYDRFEARDPFGNRIEFIQRLG